MWILLLKLCTMVFAWVALVRARIGWKGISQVADSGDYEIGVTAGRKSLFGNTPITAIRLAVRAPPTVEFTLRREGWYDRASKRIGLVIEPQIDDETFNRTVYVDCDDAELAHQFNDQAAMRKAALSLFTVGPSRGYSVDRIVCHGGRLWCVVTPRQPRDDPSRHAVAMLVPLLHRLASGLTEWSGSRRRKAPTSRAPMVQWIARLSAGLGALYLILRTFFPGRVLQPFDLFIDCVWPGILLFGLFLLVALRALRRSANSHRILIETSLLGLPGFVLCTFALATWVNVNLDFASPHSIFLHDAKKYVRLSWNRRGNTTHYYVATSPWPEQSPLKEPVEIDASTYRMLPDQGDMLVAIKPGVFGYAWVAFVVPATTH